MAQKLSIETLATLADKATIPNYDRSNLKAGIVHFGIGNFHRSHQACYLDELFNLGKDYNWALIGAGVMHFDETMRQKLEPQDFLTTLVEQENNHNSAKIIGSMIDYLSPNDKSKIIDVLSSEDIKIVSLTVTEGGYFIDPASGKFNPKHPAIIEDAKSTDNPQTVFGIMLKALENRKVKGILPFTVMSCDNIPHNGKVTKETLCGLASISNKDFANWISENVAFPNGMVDRITPATTARELDIVQKDYDIADVAPVFCEGFKQWVLEDKFTMGRPELEAVGVQFVEDVTPYEHMKIRILNGSHAAAAYPASLLEIEFMYEAMEHPVLKAFLEKLITQEVVPIVPPVPNTDLLGYYQLIETRLSNRKIADRISRLAQDGSNRQPKFILPSTRDRLNAGLDAVGLALVSALWCRYFMGTTEKGNPISFDDASSERLHKLALEAKTNPQAFLNQEDIFGELGQNPLFQKRFSEALSVILQKGTEEALRLYISGHLVDTQKIAS